MPWFLWIVTLDPLVLLPLAPGLAVSLWARHKVRRAWASGTAEAPWTRSEAGRRVLERTAAGQVPIIVDRGPLADHYDPFGPTLRLSPAVSEGRSLASAAIAAHEAGFAAWPRLGRLRARWMVLASVGGLAAWIVMAAGVLYRHNEMLMAGMILFSALTIASLALVPIERRAIRAARGALELATFGHGEAPGRILDAGAWKVACLPLTLRPLRLRR